MTRINTNVSSFVAQTNLGRTNDQLQTSLTRLSTGLRINTGKDDPAGLIASESLRSDITSIEKAINNSERANQVIATADSALGQVSNLLNDIRGLVVEAANNGALSDDEIAANQLQVDSSLEAINRIAQTTTFQGRRLLDGSLDFITDAESVANLVSLDINQANLGASGSIDANVDITAAATKADIVVTSGATNTAFTASAQATTSVVFRAESVLGGGGAFISGAEVSVLANAPGTDEEGVTISLVANAAVAVGAEVATYDSNAKTLIVQINDTVATTATNVAAAIQAQVAEFSATATTVGAIDGAGADVLVTDLTDADQLDLTAAIAGSDFNDVTVNIVADATPAATPLASYDFNTKTVTINVNNAADTSLADIVTAFTLNGQFSAVAVGNGDGNITGSTTDANATSTTGSGGGNILRDDLVVQISGESGAEVFNFQAGASANAVEAAINLVSDATGVTAANSNGTLTLNSAKFGSKQFIDVEVISEGADGRFQSDLSASRDTGTDIIAAVNGITATGDGNTLSINTATLDLSLTVTDGSETDFDFTISGGGALFQLGPDVVSNQQARLGINSVNTGKLGGTSGRLYELGSGGDKALATDSTGAFQVVDEVINKVASLRGRLGAFQRTTLETNVNSLSDTLANLLEAESSIRDADFATESAALTRAQILVQSGTSVLGIANQNPQNVLSLLR
jgi:flagellin